MTAIIEVDNLTKRYGNKRKIGIIQAFMHRPRLLILDEPTNGLDPLNQQEFDRMVKEVRDDGRTVFLSSHILTEVEQTCHRVAIIREGQLVRVGSVEELKDIKRQEITITFANAVPIEAFKGLAGVEQVETLANEHTLYSHFLSSASRWLQPCGSHREA
jgi:ABC-2 type transport system ATP-binding protein